MVMEFELEPVLQVYVLAPLTNKVDVFPIQATDGPEICTFGLTVRVVTKLSLFEFPSPIKLVVELNVYTPPQFMTAFPTKKLVLAPAASTPVKVAVMVCGNGPLMVTETGMLFKLFVPKF